MRRGAVHGFAEPAADVAAHDEAVYDQIDVVAAVAIEFGRLFDVDDLAIHPHSQVAVLLKLLEQLVILPLALLHEGCQHVNAAALGQRRDATGDLVASLGSDLGAALHAMGRAAASEQDAEIVVHLRDRPHGGAGVCATRFLRDGDRRGQTGDLIDVRLFHLPQKLARVGRQGGDISPLALGIERVEGHRRLARPAHPREADEPVFGQLDIHVLEVVDACAPDEDVAGFHLRIEGERAATRERGRRLGVAGKAEFLNVLRREDRSKTETRAIDRRGGPRYYGCGRSSQRINELR